VFCKKRLFERQLVKLETHKILVKRHKDNVNVCTFLYSGDKNSKTILQTAEKTPEERKHS